MGDWATAHPGQTISECTTSQENELTEHAASIAKLETDKLDKSFTDQMPYRFCEQYAFLGVYWGDTGANTLNVTVVRPWLHTQKHNVLNASFVNRTKFHVINLTRTNTSAESIDTTIDSNASGVVLTASPSGLNPYEIALSITLPFASASHVPYLVSCDSLDIEITE